MKVLQPWTDACPDSICRLNWDSTLGREHCDRGTAMDGQTQIDQSRGRHPGGFNQIIHRLCSSAPASLVVRHPGGCRPDHHLPYGCQHAPKPTSRPSSNAVSARVCRCPMVLSPSSYWPTRWCRGPAMCVAKTSATRYETSWPDNLQPTGVSRTSGQSVAKPFTTPARKTAHGDAKNRIPLPMHILHIAQSAAAVTCTTPARIAIDLPRDNWSNATRRHPWLHMSKQYTLPNPSRFLPVADKEHQRHMS